MIKSQAGLWVTIGLLFLPGISTAQEVLQLNIDSCLNLAMEYYPLAKQTGYLQQIAENNRKDINQNWMPQLDVNSRATYQSEVPSFDIPGFPSFNFPKDQYHFGLHLNQELYDGGQIAQQKRTDKASVEAEIQRNAVETYKVKEMVIRYYGGILLSRENIKILEGFREDVKSQLDKISSSVKNGVMLQSNADVLDAEILKTEQQLDEARSNQDVLCHSLSLLINRPVDKDTPLNDFPVAETAANDSIRRPELLMFKGQQHLMDERIRLLNHTAMPKLSLFGDGAYGRPGYNFLNQDFRFYGIAGISLIWNINHLYDFSYEKKNLSVNKNMIAQQRELFMLNLRLTMTQQEGEISKAKKVIEKDKAIVEKRKSISKITADQLENGIITSADYLTQLNAEKVAILNQRLHEIQLGASLESYQVTKGN
jgi:hypothetical protein